MSVPRTMRETHGRPPVLPRCLSRPRGAESKETKGDPMFKTILWATDGSETAAKALPFALGLAEPDHAKLVDRTRARDLRRSRRRLSRPRRRDRSSATGSSSRSPTCRASDAKRPSSFARPAPAMPRTRSRRSPKRSTQTSSWSARTATAASPDCCSAASHRACCTRASARCSRFRPGRPSKHPSASARPSRPRNPCGKAAARFRTGADAAAFRRARVLRRAN